MLLKWFVLLFVGLSTPLVGAVARNIAGPSKGNILIWVDDNFCPVQTGYGLLAQYMKVDALIEVSNQAFTSGSRSLQLRLPRGKPAGLLEAFNIGTQVKWPHCRMVAVLGSGERWSNGTPGELSQVVGFAMNTSYPAFLSRLEAAWLDKGLTLHSVNPDVNEVDSLTRKASIIDKPTNAEELLLALSFADRKEWFWRLCPSGPPANPEYCRRPSVDFDGRSFARNPPANETGDYMLFYAWGEHPLLQAVMATISTQPVGRRIGFYQFAFPFQALDDRRNRDWAKGVQFHTDGTVARSSTWDLYFLGAYNRPEAWLRALADDFKVRALTASTQVSERSCYVNLEGREPFWEEPLAKDRADEVSTVQALLELATSLSHRRKENLQLEVPDELRAISLRPARPEERIQSLTDLVLLRLPKEMEGVWYFVQTTEVGGRRLGWLPLPKYTDLTEPGSIKVTGEDNFGGNATVVKSEPKPPWKIYQEWPFSAKEAQRRQNETAEAMGIPAAKTLDLGNGVSMEFVLIPAGRYIMGTPEPEEPAKGPMSLLLAPVLTLVLFVIIFVQAIRKRRRPQCSLAYLLGVMVCTSLTVWGGVNWWQAEQYKAARARYEAIADVEKPAHNMTISRPFYIGKHEVTQEQYRQVVGNLSGRQSNIGGYPYKKGCKLGAQSSGQVEVQGPKHPVDGDFDANLFIRELLVKHAVVGRLPTEAEWEYACRAGIQAEYHGGNGVEALSKVGWCRYDGKALDMGGTKEVGSFSPNNWGLYDTHGNVAEMCEEKVFRGGGWASPPEHCRSAYRYGKRPDNGKGFRLILEF